MSENFTEFMARTRRELKERCALIYDSFLAPLSDEELAAILTQQKQELRALLVKGTEEQKQRLLALLAKGAGDRN